MMFKCDCCGECCRHISGILELKDYCLPDGKCKYLKENKCSIYTERPMICRVDDMYYKVMYKYMTLKQFYRINTDACEIFKKMKDREEK